MWPTNHWTSNFWQTKHWPVIVSFIENKAIQLRTRRLIDERWNVFLVNSVGTRYDLGWVDIPTDTAVSIAIPESMPDGLYDVEVQTSGMAWEGLVQKNRGSVLIDSTSSEPVSVGLPLFTNLRYDAYQGYTRLLWDGEVSPDDSGLVSTGIWLSNGVPDFEMDPTLTIPVFSFETTHTYTLFEEESYTHAGIAAMRETEAGIDQGTGQWILLPTDAEVITVDDPSVTVLEG